MANIFDVSNHALTVPDIDTYTGLMHTSLHWKDMYSLKSGRLTGKSACAFGQIRHSTNVPCSIVPRMQDKAAKLEQGEITKEGIRPWRVRSSPELDTFASLAKVPSQARPTICLWRNFRKSRKKKRKQTKKKKQK